MSGSAWNDLRADLGRYTRVEWLKEPSVWAIAVYRLGRRSLERSGLSRWLLSAVYAATHTPVQLLTGISIPRSAVVGPGLRIYHFGGIVVHPGVTIGRHCTLGHGVTLGVREDGRTPRVGDDVVLSAYAQVLGGVTIGDGVKVGAMSVVLRDLPAGVTAAGVPARVLGERAAAD